ncbi:MAG: DNA primase regulatory subunit PriL [Candidatus Thermoplasmatota archaeon]|nr:DNA primase regulatory subunit PriL [Candidatus Thermoplasmatota archaeon]MCL5731135.1 DNA primase regulatory subunit PriL [Candidatus Thermoplasmatota archaeon]
MMPQNTGKIFLKSLFDFEENKKIFTSFLSDDINTIKEAVEFISKYLRDPKEKRSWHRINAKLLPIVLIFLKGISEPVLSNRIMIHFRRVAEEEGQRMNMEDLESALNSLGLEAELDANDDLISVSLKDYVSIAGKISGSTYHLIYQDLRSGRVFLDKDHALKVLREHFYSRMRLYYEKIPLEEVISLTKSYSVDMEKIKDIYTKTLGKIDFGFGAVDSDKFPPCIREYIRQVSDGVNIPHLARLTLVSFLRAVGMPNEKIMEIFRTAPDFNESITEYQVNHITGKTSGTKYSPPKCETLQSNHLCYKGDDALCAQEWMKHPLTYYRTKKRESLKKRS